MTDGDAHPDADDSASDLEPAEYSFRRFLEAKRTVDRRAYDRRVRDRFRTALADRSGPLRILEVGAGTGSTVADLAEWSLGPVEYVALDSDPDVVAAARRRLADRPDARDVDATAGDGGTDADDEADDRATDATADTGRVVLDRPGGEFSVDVRREDALDHLDRAAGRYDAVVAQAFVDLTQVGAFVAAAHSALSPGGLLYCPITFDGVTDLRPRVDPDLDRQIERRFHRRIDTTEKAGGHTGDSRAGSRLLTAVPEAGGTVLAAGGSDWVVTPGSDPTAGGSTDAGHHEGSTDAGSDDADRSDPDEPVPGASQYPADEAYFLHHVVDLVRGAVRADGAVDGDRLGEWARRRHRQIRDGELVYSTHQLDVLGRAPAD